MMKALGSLSSEWPALKSVCPSIRKWVTSSPLWYISLVNQAAGITMGLVMKTGGKPEALSSLQRTISSVDPNVPVYDMKTMSERYSEFLAHPRFRAVLMGTLAGLTLLLTAIGFYGVLAQLVIQRTQEIGVRMSSAGPSGPHVRARVL
jgi:hypothetical protein